MAMVSQRKTRASHASHAPVGHSTDGAGRRAEANCLQPPQAVGRHFSATASTAAHAIKAIHMLISSQTYTERAAWLRKLYFIRAAFSFIWVGLAFSVARNSPSFATLLLIVYPAWDAAANLLDVRMAGGASANRSQVLNIWISAGVAAAVAIVSVLQLPAVLLILGLWAVLSGLMQLATAIRRRKSDRGQWIMMLSGAQSALAGAFFVSQQGGATPVIEIFRGYATLGAVYFLISALVVLLRKDKADGTASGAA
jgi:hypothetical protein